MSAISLELRLLPERLSVARLDADAPVPGWAQGGPLTCVTRTAAELSVLCPEDRVPPGVRVETGFRAIMVEGPLGFQLTGVLASMATPLADALVPIFAISTFDTDYVLVRDRDAARAARALRAAGHVIDAG